MLGFPTSPILYLHHISDKTNKLEPFQIQLLDVWYKQIMNKTPIIEKSVWVSEEEKQKKAIFYCIRQCRNHFRLFFDLYNSTYRLHCAYNGGICFTFYCGQHCGSQASSLTWKFSYTCHRVWRPLQCDAVRCDASYFQSWTLFHRLCTDTMGVRLNFSWKVSSSLSWLYHQALANLQKN